MPVKLYLQIIPINYIRNYVRKRDDYSRYFLYITVTKLSLLGEISTFSVHGCNETVTFSRNFVSFYTRL